MNTQKEHPSLRRCLLALWMITLLVGAAPVSAAFASAAPASPSVAAHTLGDPQELETFMDGMMASQLPEQHVAGAVVVVVKDGQVLLAKGYGYADVEKRIPVDAEHTLFRPGSATKLFTWTAVMQLVEQGKIDLQADVNAYLTRFKIPTTYPRPITMLDLMAHTAGFEEREMNLFKSSVSEMTSLEDYLVQNMPARVFPPGQVPAYSNYGTALAGYIVEQVSGQTYEQYIEEYIFEPLGMNHSTMEQPLPEALAPDMSLGYSFNRGYHAEEFELVQASPAGALSASGLDMGSFMLAHLQDGEYNGARILKTETAQLMHTQSNTFDPALPGMAHGFMEAYINGRRLICHGGETYQFTTLLALLPEEHTGIYFSYNSPSPQARDAFLRAFMDRYFPGTPVAVPQPPADFASRVARYTGFYETSRMVYTTSDKVFASILAVQPGPGNTLRIPDLASFDMSDTWVEVRPLVMQNIRTGELAVFRQDERGEVLYAGVGNWPIITLIKLPWYGGPFVKFGLLGFSLLISLFTVIAAIVTPFIPLRKREADGRQPPWPGRLARWTALLWCVLAIALVTFIIMVFMGVADHTNSTSEVVFAVLPWAITVLTPIVGLLAGFAWWKHWWGPAGRIHYTVIALAAFCLLWFEIYWSLL